MLYNTTMRVPYEMQKMVRALYQEGKLRGSSGSSGSKSTSKDGSRVVLPAVVIRVSCRDMGGRDMWEIWGVSGARPLSKASS